MTIRCAAVFSNGVLTPTQPIRLPEGAEVEIVVLSSPGQRPAAAILRAIAGLPMENDDRGFSGKDHDQVLYGDQTSRQQGTS